MQYSVGSLLIYAFVNVLHIYIVNHLLNAVLGKVSHRIAAIVLNILFYASIFLVFLFGNSDLLTILVNACFMFLIATVHQSELSRKVLSCVILLPTFTGLEVIVSLCAALFVENPLSRGRNSGIMLTLVVISKMVILVLTNLMCPLLKKIHKSTSLIGIPGIYWISIILIPIANMVVIYEFYVHWLKEGPASLQVCLCIVLVVGITLLVFIFYNQILDSNEAKAKLIVQDLQIKNYILAYQNFQSMANEAFEIKHNLKNLAIALLKDLDSDDCEGQDRARTKLQHIVGEHKNICRRKWSGIPIIDAILNTKSGIAQNLGIQVEADIRISSFHLDDDLICVILGNALDNAIEACNKVSQEKRLIQLVMSDEQANLFISITNPYNGEITFRKDSHLPSSTKCNPSEHGYGLKSIQCLVQQKDGIFDINVENNHFQLNIVLYQNAC